jgi:hypothetical protein
VAVPGFVSWRVRALLSAGKTQQAASRRKIPGSRRISEGFFIGESGVTPLSKFSWYKIEAYRNSMLTNHVQ